MLKWSVSATLAVCMTACAGAQEMTAAKIVFNDPGPFAQADLEAVAGLHAGQVVVLKDLQAAAQRLADTGCFEDVRMDSAGSPRALTIIFLLRPTVTGELYPVRFENFFAESPEELEAAVHRSVPLFRTSLPETTSVLDTVSAALQVELAGKGVPHAEVSHEIRAASSEQPQTAVVFRVSRPAMVLRSVTVEAAPGPASLPGAAMERIATKLKGTPYVSGEDVGSTADLLVKPYQDAGYIEAKLASAKATASPVEEGKLGIDLTGKVDSGPLFHFGQVSFSETPVVSAQAFEGMSKMHPGEIASRAAIAATEAPMDAAYHKLGYMYAYVEPHASKDESAHTVSYSLSVVPGEVYRLHTIQVEGLPPEAKALFNTAWKMQPGDPYDAEYASAFLHDNSALRGLQGYAGTFQAAADPATHGVDLTVLFARVSGR